jgi:SAM-dependent methyltransferase
MTMNLRSAFADPDYFTLSDEEADFGFGEIARLIAARGGAGLKCLEIGSGPGLLLGRLQERFPQCSFEGIEPVGSGFAKTEAPLAEITARTNLTVHRCGYEDFAPRATYDLIFSINVFEHVASWRDYLTRTRGWLAPGGASVMLCPNYSFPWEPHFRIPIIGGKQTTYSVFAARIESYERREHYEGLWASVNFVKKREVLAFARETGLEVSSDDSVMQRTIERLFKDPAFAKRQRALGWAAKLFYRLGLTRLLEMPGLRLLAPFMSLQLAK